MQRKHQQTAIYSSPALFEIECSLSMTQDRCITQAVRMIYAVYIGRVCVYTAQPIRRAATNGCYSRGKVQLEVVRSAVVCRMAAQVNGRLRGTCTVDSVDISVLIFLVSDRDTTFLGCKLCNDDHAYFTTHRAADGDEQCGKAL